MQTANPLHAKKQRHTGKLVTGVMKRSALFSTASFIMLASAVRAEAGKDLMNGDGKFTAKFPTIPDPTDEKA